jgi:hypothetical protein
MSDTPRQEDRDEQEVTPPRIRVPSTTTPPGQKSNAVITARNGGVQHQFANDIGGCSANYR